MKTKISILVSFCLVASVVCGQGIIIEHSGASNPVSEGFGVSGFGTSETEGVTDLGINAWSTTINASGVEYTGSFSSLAAVDWTLSATLRIVTTNINPSSGTFYVSIVTGSTYFRMLFGSDSNGDAMIIVNSYTNASPVIVLDGAGSTYNTFQLVYDASANAAALWINGTEQFSDISGYLLASSPNLQWGSEYQGPANRQANWSEISLSVPEPSAFSLIFLGSGILIYVRRIKKHVRI
ncbi:MAG: PEP-CTERM sorting domain-containing protein [Limisphaerales bacterium]